MTPSMGHKGHLFITCALFSCATSHTYIHMITSIHKDTCSRDTHVRGFPSWWSLVIRHTLTVATCRAVCFY